MAKIIPYPHERRGRALDGHSRHLLEIADEIDSVILRHLGDDIDSRDMAGLLAHRLGTLMRHVTKKDREILWAVCKKVLKEQADLKETEELTAN